LVCQIVIQVVVIVANMCPLREIRRARMGSFWGIVAVSGVACGRSSGSFAKLCSTDLISGVWGVVGVMGDMGEAVGTRLVLSWLEPVASSDGRLSSWLLSWVEGVETSPSCDTTNLKFGGSLLLVA
jgi:hypothetical protein